MYLNSRNRRKYNLYNYFESFTNQLEQSNLNLSVHPSSNYYNSSVNELGFIKLYNQANITASRKQVVPIVGDIIAKL